MASKEVLTTIERSIRSTNKRPLLVCVDGVDGSGKSYFAKELTAYLAEKDYHVIHTSVDGFHNPAAISYKKGKNSPEGFYYDSYNYEALKENLLEPFSRGAGQYKLAIFDSETDSSIDSPPVDVETDSVLIIDGIFLQRPELISYWDVQIFLDVDVEVVIRRTIERDKDLRVLGSEAEIIQKYKQRYIPSQQIYIKEVQPKQKATIVIDNNDFQHPRILRKVIV